MYIGDLLTQTARNYPDKVGVIWQEKRISWAQLNTKVNKLSRALLALGLAPGSRVAFVLDNGPEIIELYYAIAKAGLVAAPIMPRSVGREIAHIVNNVEAKLVFVSEQFESLVADASTEFKHAVKTIGIGNTPGLQLDYETLIAAQVGEEPVIDIAADALYAIIHTSGTTGFPKGCMLSHSAKIFSRLTAVAQTPHLGDDKGLIYMPLATSLGADMMHNYVMTGVPFVLMPKFDEIGLLQLVQDEKITLINVIESTFDRLVARDDLDKYDLSSLRFFMATSATRDTSTGIQRLNALKNFSAKFWNGYGCTEGGGWLSHIDGNDLSLAAANPAHKHLLKSIGREALMCRVECLDVNGKVLPPNEIGELAFYSPQLFVGYWNDPVKTEETLVNGGLRTGDLGRKDKDGYIYLEGRMKDMIKSGGINVYPAEIEGVLRDHPDVKEVAVVGIPDAEWGEKVVACIVARGHCDEQSLVSLCEKELAGFKRPKTFVFMDSFPKDVVGKVLKREIRDCLY